MLANGLKKILGYPDSGSTSVNLHEEDAVRPILITGCIRQEMAISFNNNEHPLFQNIPNGMIDIVLKYHGRTKSNVVYEG